MSDQASNLTATSFDSTNPLAYLPTTISHDLAIASYILVGALVVQIWDIANNLGTDYMLLTKHRMKLPAMVYCISRLSTLIYLFVATIYETAPIGNCMTLSKLPPWIFMIALPSTSLLFYFRVSAMYDNNRFISAFFFLMWIGVVGGCVPSTMGVSGARIGTTKYCISTTLKHYVATGTIIPLIYDSAVFFAISWRLMRVNLADDLDLNFKDALKAIIFGKKLTKFSKALLQDGQAYYLSTVGLSLSVLIIFYIDSIPLIYRTLLGLPDFTLMNVMACRVYRKTKSGIYCENATLDRIAEEPMVFSHPADPPWPSEFFPERNSRRHDITNQEVSEGSINTTAHSDNMTNILEKEEV